MNNESKTLWISLGFGLLAGFFVYSYLQSVKSSYDKDFGAMKNVLVAKQNIEEMRTIDDTLVEVIQRPGNFIEPGALSDPEQAVGQVAGKSIKKGEQILDSKLLIPGAETGISLQVAPSKRAVTLPVDEVRGVAKLIRPGDRIDIYAALDSGKGVNQRREVSLIMQDVVVLATGVNVVNNIPRSIETDSSGKNNFVVNLSSDTKYGSLTIEASPKEAQDLIFIVATSPANIYFTLRNPNDRAVPPRVPASNSDSVAGRPVASFDNPPAAAPPMMVMPPQPPPILQQRPVPTVLPKKKGTFRDF
jgi:pilus assembly protein CpaB